MIRRRATLALAAAAVGTVGTACTERDVVAVVGAGPDLATYCAGSGPPVLVGDVCTGDVAAAVFRQAVCACGPLGLSAELATDGFDSRLGPWTPGGAGGDVASNVGLATNATLTVGGELIVAGADGVQAGPRLDVIGDLAVAGGVGRPASTVTVGGAARIGGDVDLAGLTVAGTLTTAPGVATTGAISAGSRTTAAVTVPPPCRCDPADALDVAATIAAHAQVNHDAAVGITPAQLADVTGDVTLELPCGRFYLTRVQATGGGTVTIRATGRTALFVAGDVTLDGDLVVEVTPGAELDLFVGGFLNIPGAVTLGDPARPRDLRLYLASAGALALAGTSTVAANLYAPAADLATSAPIAIFGAVLVNRWAGSAPATLHYDRAITLAADACPR